MIEKCLNDWHRHLRGELPGGLDALLADDVVFYSPIVFTPQKGKDIRFIFFVCGEYRRVDLYLIVIIIREEGAQGTVNETCRQGFYLTGSSYIPAEVVPGYSSTRVGHLLIFHCKGEEINPLADLICTDNRHQYDCLPKSHDDRTTRLLRYTTGFDV